LTRGVARLGARGVAHSDAHVTMRPPARRARWAGARIRAIVSSALLLVLPARALAKDRTLCFRLPPPSSLTAAPRDPDADPDPARAYLGMKAERCVPRAERDLRAAAVRARLPEDDPALRCVDAHESFLCAADLAAPDDPFSCETLDGAEVYRRNETTMHTCVWPVCEALCVQHPAPGSSRAVRRRGAPRNANAVAENKPPSSERRHPSVCARCGRACAASPPSGDTPGGRYCAALDAQRRPARAPRRAVRKRLGLSRLRRRNVLRRILLRIPRGGDDAARRKADVADFSRRRRAGVCVGRRRRAVRRPRRRRPRRPRRPRRARLW